MTALTQSRRVVFFDAQGAPYQPVRHGDRKTGRSVFKIKPKGASNRAAEALQTEDILEVARAMLVDGLAARCKALGGGDVNYLRYGAEKLLSYEIGPEIAQALGIPAKGSAGDMAVVVSRKAVEAAMDAFDRYSQNGEESEIFRHFGDPRDYWVRSSRDRDNRVYPSKPIVGYLLKKTELNGGWGQKADAAARLHNSGFIIVDQKDEPVQAPERCEHLISGADRIRLCALNYFIEPAREKGLMNVAIRAGDLASAMGLKNAFPNICQTLGGEKLQQLAQVPPPIISEPNPSSSTAFTYELGSKLEADTMNQTSTTISASATNLILYGPPGTGKTFTTAAEAVHLCGEHVPQHRAELVKIYRRLVAAGRIKFVTFHQSMSYEEFVEGLRPETSGAEGKEPESDGVDTGGFRLKVEDGVFKRICERARLDPGEHGSRQGLDRQRNLFKLSLIGANWQEQLSSALANDRIFWGFGAGVDWSPPEFEEFEAVKQRWREDDPQKHGTSADISGTWYFRGAVDVGDYVLLSVGKNRIVGLAEVVGDYEHDPREDREHSRRVRWIWHSADGAQRSDFYPERFSAFQPIYQLAADRIDWDVLDDIAFGAKPPREPSEARDYVLIIDEINRANISKVFGELITLLEPDKRLLADNEIRLTLPYSKRLFGVPSNLHLIGTMNTADRSIALLDTALRRRFTFREMMPDASVLEEAGQKCGIDLPGLLSTINERIEYLYDREHQIGHAYFSSCRSEGDVDEVMRHKVIPLLAEYFFEDWAKIAAVLGDLETHEGPITGGFLKRAILNAPPGLEDGDTVPRFRWQVRSVDEGFDYGRLVGT
ncbi:5-methylcytosine-specific restriction enzyme B [Salinihabitans flavidus]|uniref:5-methylcytosine-specific restriction enzyme B n=1 Tax=Salinihabitans flavidus TaxID=569882 RepID=A0A1H8TJ62_9RHOB|nr:AAA family ATPase [Salinihabitans flavidus]SEO90584.1 5-methylcytosine-specific restriction enzyme B [Salinihabitans flavidus]